MQPLEYRLSVKNDSGEPFELVAKWDHALQTLTCSCEDAAIGLFCDHRERFLNFDVSIVDHSDAPDFNLMRRRMESWELVKRFITMRDEIAQRKGAFAEFLDTGELPESANN